jgi:ABC-type antimicrobial peptide transport system permease subunit
VYGVVAYGVTQRRREIGIRMALGATREATVRLVMRDGLRLLAFGICMGLPLLVYAQLELEPVLFRIRFWDLAGLAPAMTLLVACVVVASLVPARRAASVDPAVALRNQ